MLWASITAIQRKAFTWAGFRKSCLFLMDCICSFSRETMFAGAKKGGKNSRVLYRNTQGIHHNKPASWQELFCSAAFHLGGAAHAWQHELWALLLPQGPEQKASCLPRRDLGHPAVGLTQVTHKPFHFLSTCSFKLVRNQKASEHAGPLLLGCDLFQTRNAQNGTILPKEQNFFPWKRLVDSVTEENSLKRSFITGLGSWFIIHSSMHVWICFPCHHVSVYPIFAGPDLGDWLCNFWKCCCGHRLNSNKLINCKIV